MWDTIIDADDRFMVTSLFLLSPSIVVHSNCKGNTFFNDEYRKKKEVNKEREYL